MATEHYPCPHCALPITPAERCPHCGAELIHAAEWLHIYTVSTEWEATLLQGMLEAHGIPVVVLSQRDSSRQLTVGHLALVRLYVPIPFAIEAFRLLTDYEAGQQPESGTGGETQD